MIFNLNLIVIAVILSLNINFTIDKKSLQQDHSHVIIDCDYTFEEAITGIEIPKNILSQLALIEVEYYSFDKRIHRGQVLLNIKAVKDVKEIFEIIKEIKFPVNKVIPIAFYKWSDEGSMNDNNTSAFNYRKVKGTKVISAHSYGLAIDINPMQNPHIKNGTSKPVNAKYDINEPGTILKGSRIVNEFKKRGWQWGGTWRSSKDYQHFEKKN